MTRAMELTGLCIEIAQMAFSVNYQREATADFRNFCAHHEIQIAAYQLLQPQVIVNPVVRDIASALIHR